MSIFFISDLHLHASRPHITERFFQFLKQEARGAEALYILGDFFEVWIGEDILNEHDKNIVHQLAQYAKNTPVYFMQGNRDFLIEQSFAQKMGCTLISDPFSLKINGQNYLLMHGDKLCTLDVSYQRYRKLVHLSWIKKLFLNLPTRFRQKIAGMLRQQSMQNKEKYQVMLNERVRNGNASDTTATTFDTITHQVNELKTSSDLNPKNANKVPLENSHDVCREAVIEHLIQYNSQILIHGHTHKPGIHEFQYNDKRMQRIVLGEWKREECFVYWLSKNEPSLLNLIEH